MDFQIPIDRHNRLVIPSIDHAEELFALVDTNRDHLGKFLAWVPHNKTVQDSIDFIKSRDHEDTYSGKYALLILQNGKIAGIIDFHKGKRSPKSLEIGYWLSKSFSGKGLMTKACAALIDFAYKNSDVNRIVICCATKNFKSQAIPERLGFTKEGVGRQYGLLNGEHFDVNVNSILRSEWESQQIANRYIESEAS